MKLLVAITGPTASGKTPFAIALAKRVGGEIIGMDSTTVYRGFDIGSSKPTAEEQHAVPHHLIDCLGPDEPFSAGKFVSLAEAAIQEIGQRGKLPILVGGTYFYLRALQHGMFPVPEVGEEVVEGIEREFADGESEREGAGTRRLHQALTKVDSLAAQTIHPHDRYRLVRALAIFRATGKKASELKPEPKAQTTDRYWLKYAMTIPRERLHQMIENRTNVMIKRGLVEETERIGKQFPQARALASIGYAEVVASLKGQLGGKDLRQTIIEKTRQLAKRQTTWLRSDNEMRFIDDRDLDRAELEIKNLLHLFQGGMACAR